MGATAISVLSAVHILQLPHILPIVTATATTVSGFGYLLWAVGTWWIPFLGIFGLWRHLTHHVPLRYTTALWSIVFPLGMYSAASITFDATLRTSFMVDAGRIGTVIAGLAWLAVVVFACRAALRTLPATKQHIAPPTDGSSS